MIPEVCNSAIGLTLIDDVGYCREARGESSGWRTREQLELNAAENAFQWATELTGHNIEFQSDSEPTLLKIMEMYAQAKEERFKNSDSFGNSTKTPANFKAMAFNLVSRFDNIMPAAISRLCNNPSLMINGLMKNPQN